MKTSELFQRLWRKIELTTPSPLRGLRKAIWKLRGASIGSGTSLPRCTVTWPHQLKIGSDCRLGPGVFFNFSHYWVPGPSIIIGNNVFIGSGVEFNCRARIVVGDNCLIAGGCRFIDSDHGISPDVLIGDQELTCAPITIREGAWVGANAIVLKGVTIGAGAVIAAGAVVTQSAGDMEIWAGVPARKAGDRRDAGRA